MDAPRAVLQIREPSPYVNRVRLMMMIITIILIVCRLPRL